MKDQLYWRTFWALYIGLVMFFNFFLALFAMAGVVHSVPPGTPLFPMLFSFWVSWAAVSAVLLFVIPFGIITIATANMDGEARAEQLQSLERDGRLIALYGNFAGPLYSVLWCRVLFPSYIVLRFYIGLIRAMDPPDEGVTN